MAKEEPPRKRCPGGVHWLPVWWAQDYCLFCEPERLEELKAKAREMFGDVTKPTTPQEGFRNEPGRPRVHGSNAERQRAYRERQ